MKLISDLRLLTSVIDDLNDFNDLKAFNDLSLFLTNTSSLLSWLLLKLSGNNSGVECNLAKVEVAGSNPVSRSIAYERLILGRFFI